MTHRGENTLNDFHTIHFVGIGGIGMSALARLCLHEGKKVSGSDRTPSLITDTLVREGVQFFSDQKKGNIGDDVDLVVYTEAMPKDHEELVTARQKNIPLMNYLEALGMVANEYYLIAVSGTHGKTTTTSMLIDILEDAGLDPTAIVGSLRARTKRNFRAGKSQYFIAEACEYKRDFLSLSPNLLVITNVEHEHVDYYPTLEAVQHAFRELVRKVPEGGYIVLNGSDKDVLPCVEGARATIVDYTGFFDPMRPLKIPGMHHQMNAAAAVAAAAQLGVGVEDANRTLAQFQNSWRRFEYRGEYNGTRVYDDYGHHPTEVRVTIQGAREQHPDKRIVLVFQPHTYSRTHTLLKDFATALQRADRVYVLPIYAAREKNESGVTHQDLARAVGEKAVAVDDFSAVEEMVRREVGSNDVVIVMGAGDVTKVADVLTK